MVVDDAGHIKHDTEGRLQRDRVMTDLDGVDSGHRLAQPPGIGARSPFRGIGPILQHREPGDACGNRRARKRKCSGHRVHNGAARLGRPSRAAAAATAAAAAVATARAVCSTGGLCRAGGTRRERQRRRVCGKVNQS